MTETCMNCSRTSRSGWEQEYTVCAHRKIDTFVESDDSNLFSLGSMYFNGTRDYLYIFITYTRCDNTHGFINVPANVSVGRLDIIRAILMALVNRSAERGIPVTQIRLYAGQPARSGTQVGKTKYHMHKTHTIDLVTNNRSLASKLMAVGSKMLNGDPGFKHLTPEVIHADWCSLCNEDTVVGNVCDGLCPRPYKVTGSEVSGGGISHEK